MARETLYEVLQVRATAEPEVIEAAYKRLAAKYHPDRNHAPDATERMRQLNDAFHVLKDPARRAAYDAELRRRRQGSGRDRQPDAAPRARTAPVGEPPSGPPPAPEPPRRRAKRRAAGSGKAETSGAARQRATSWYGWVPRVAGFIVMYAVVRHACAPSPQATTMPLPVEAPRLPTPPATQRPSRSTAPIGSILCVANTAGEGVYLRTLPQLEARFGAAYPEGTSLQVDKADCSPGGGGNGFCFVRAPDGATGYVPGRYVAASCAARPATVTPPPQERSAKPRKPSTELKGSPCSWHLDCGAKQRCEGATVRSRGFCVEEPSIDSTSSGESLQDLIERTPSPGSAAPTTSPPTEVVAPRRPNGTCYWTSDCAFGQRCEAGRCVGD
jgi:hypothetical protein